MDLKPTEFISPAQYIAEIERRQKLTELAGGMMTGFYYAAIDEGQYVYGDTLIEGLVFGDSSNEVEFTLCVGGVVSQFSIPINYEGFTIDCENRPYGYFSAVNPGDEPSLELSHQLLLGSSLTLLNT